MSYDSILVPTDGSDYAARATEHALSLASRFDAEVHALAAIDLGSAAGPFDAGGIDEEFADQLTQRARENLEHVENKWAQPDRFHGEVRKGTPSEVILEYVREEDVDMIAMGTHGRQGLRRFVLGSVSEHVLRKSPVPVLATRMADDPPRLPYREILVPTDGSEYADRALEHALAIATVCDARIHTLNVVEESLVTATPGGGLPSEYLDRLESSGEEAMNEIVERAREAGLETETAMRQAVPGDGIADYAVENDVDLVVMGTHGRTGLERVVLGSTTERVIRRDEFPVLAVPEANDEN